MIGKVHFRPVAIMGVAWVLFFAVHPSWGTVPQQKEKTPQSRARSEVNRDGVAEARLIEIYQLIGNSNHRSALENAEKLVKDYPNFQLAQLVYGDLLATRLGRLRVIGDPPAELANANMVNLRALRAEAQLRMTALKERPPVGAVPPQFLSLSQRNKHAIAVDVSKARLYLFENTGKEIKLLADYYISVGKAGTGKAVEGDQRTPLGLYFITSNLDPRSLKDLYGSGALPINYPNVLDIRRGKTGSGIWLHGTPSSQFSRAPLATDGCVAVANPDLERIVRTVEIRTTPVLIAQNLKWTSAQSLSSEKQTFEEVLHSWGKAKSTGDVDRFIDFYSPGFNADGKDRVAYAAIMRADGMRRKGRALALKDISFLRWTDEEDVMVTTLGEVAEGAKAGRTIRQYWERRNKKWEIFYEGVLN